jgi:hypothetical protein
VVPVITTVVVGEFTFVMVPVPLKKLQVPVSPEVATVFPAKVKVELLQLV